MKTYAYLIAALPCICLGGPSAPILRMTLPASWDENWFGSPAVYDLDDDGHCEIIAGRHSVLYVWSSDGDSRWRAPVGENASSPNDHGSARQYASPVVGDLDNDGNGEIAIAYSNKAAVYDHSGALLPGWPQTFPGPDGEIRAIAAADLEGDGAFEILVVKTGRGPVTMAWRIDGSGVAGWPQAANCDECNDYGGYNQNIGAADLDGDSLPETVSSYDQCHIGIMHADGSPYAAHSSFSAAGPWVSSVPLFHDIALAQQGWGADGNARDEFTDSPPVFGDIDRDGVAEVILYSDYELAGEYQIRGNCLWAFNVDLSRAAGFAQPLCSGEPLFTGYTDNIVQVAPAPALGDLSGDGDLEIVAPSYDGLMRCFSANGREQWSWRFDTRGAPFIGASGPVIGDLNADGAAEVVFTTYSVAQDVSEMIILDAEGTLVHAVAIAGRGSMSPPTLDDIDGNGELEIVVSLKDILGGGKGGVQIWDIAGADTSKRDWPTGRGNYLRDGNFGTHQKASIQSNGRHQRSGREQPLLVRRYTIRGEAIAERQCQADMLIIVATPNGRGRLRRSIERW